MAKETEMTESNSGFKFKYCFYTVLIILFILALYSHQAIDFSILQGGYDAAIGNWIGITGAYVSCILLLLFGLAIWPIVILLVVCALRPLLHFPTHRKGYFGALLVIALGTTILFGMYPADFVNRTDVLGIGRKEVPEGALSGGVIGQQLAAPKYGEYDAGILRHYIGSVGTMTAALVFLAVGLFFVYRADWHNVMIYLFTHKLPELADKVGSGSGDDKNKPGKEREKIMPPAAAIPESAAPAAAKKTAREMLSGLVPSRKDKKTAAVEPEELPEDDGEPLKVKGGSLLQRILAGEEFGETGGEAPKLRADETVNELIVGDTDDDEEFDAGKTIEEKMPSLGIPATPRKAEPAKPEPVRPVIVQAPPPAPVSKAKPAFKPSAPASGDLYVLPPVTMMSKVPELKSDNTEQLKRASEVLQQTLESFKVDGQVTSIISGPRIIRFEISLAPGVKVEKVANIANNIAMELEAESIRILAPIPGRNAVGVEAPNPTPSAVFLRSVMESPQWRESKVEVPIVLGKDVTGKAVVMDLAKAPHLLIAGSTGSGKSVCMNTLIMSLLMRFRPEELRLIMVDPKVVEMAMYNRLPHLITPVVNDPHKIPLALRWAVNEMEKRYRILAKVHTRNLAGFNARNLPPEPVMDDNGEPIPARLPYLVIIIDELADVMMTDAKSEVETSVARIAQKGRAAGIHIVIATQRPSTNIITGVIKANLPTRIAFKVGSIVDSRVILDQKGAETLLGRGDMLYVPPGSANLERIQGAMVDDADIEKVVEFVSSQVEQRFDDTVIAEQEIVTAPDDDDVFYDDEDGDAASIYDTPDLDPVMRKYLLPEDGDLVRKALEITLSERKVSTSYLQRRLGIGYNRAAEIIDKLEERGIVGPPQQGGSKREILVFDEIDNA